MTTGTVSIVVRVRNEAQFLRELLGILAVQEMEPAEIIVVDNASSDSSRQVALEYGARVIDISKDEFSYGRALNRGIQQTTGEFICILSAHTVPLGTDFLQKSILPFSDPQVGAVRCLSLRNPQEIVRWYQPRTLQWPVDLDTVIAEGPINCAAVIRRCVWEKIPYDEMLRAVEDKFWAFEVLKGGYRIAKSAAPYLYTKERSLSDQLRTMNGDRLAYFRITGRQFQQPPISLRKLLFTLVYSIPRRALKTAVFEMVLYFRLKTIPLQARAKAKTGSVR